MQITNPYDVPVKIYDVQTQLPVELIDPAMKIGKGCFLSLTLRTADRLLTYTVARCFSTAAPLGSICTSGEKTITFAFTSTRTLAQSYPAEGHGTERQTVPTGGLFNSTAVARSAMLAPQIGGGIPGGFISVSSNGTADGIVWALTTHACDANQHVEPGILLAFDTIHFSGSGLAGTLSLLWNSTQNLARDDLGYFAKFTYPTIANG